MRDSTSVMRTDSSPDLEDTEHHTSSYEYMNRSSTPLASLGASISPPPSRTRRSKEKSCVVEAEFTNNNNGRQIPFSAQEEGARPNLAGIEAGETQIRNHLEYFSTHLSQRTSPRSSLSIPDFKNLYKRNQHPHGRHWVIHQHDHPVAGVHYDLRLQINETSSISWAIMYGLPGNVNSRRLNRNATETRVHNVWVGR